MNTYRNQILRLPAVLAMTGLSRSTIYMRIGEGLWTTPVRLGLRAVGWPADEVTAINVARIAGRSDAEIRTLVKLLKSARNVVREETCYDSY